MITKIINGVLIDDNVKGSEVIIENGVIVEKIKSDEKIDLIIDAKGKYVSSGFIDSHVHVFENISLNGVNPDDIGIKMGVTDIIDAGSTGSNDFKTFNEDIIEKSKTNVYSLLNISKTGLVDNLQELKDMSFLSDSEEITTLMKTYKNKIIGIKVRLSASVVGDNGVKPLEEALKVANINQLPIMVHVGNPPPYLPDVFPLLRSGDIVTHAFHGKETNTIFDKNDELLEEAIDALNRGVLFDVGHGSASFGFEVFDKFIKKYGHYKFSTSTDIHIRNINGPVFSLMATLSKLYSYGITIPELVNSVTKVPSEVFSLKNKGSLLPGNKGDISIFSVVDEEIILTDSLGIDRKIEKQFKAEKTIIDGKIIWENK